MNDAVVIVLVSVVGLVSVALLLGVVGCVVLSLLMVHRLTMANDVLTGKVMVFAEREVGDLRLDRYGPGQADRVRVQQSASVVDPQEGFTLGGMISRGSIGGDG